MLVRLGNVLYWIGCAIALLLAIGGVFAGLNESTSTKNAWEVLAFFEAGALLAWLAGKGCRYILSGK